MDMCLPKLRTTLFCSGLFLLAACGEMDTVFPSVGSYRVSARVNEISLEECSVVNRNSKIRPYFVNSIANDPDITGLAVYLQTVRGEIISQKVRYTLSATAQAPSGDEKPPENSGTAAGKIDTPAAPASQQTGKDPQTGDQKAEGQNGTKAEEHVEEKSGNDGTQKTASPPAQAAPVTLPSTEEPPGIPSKDEKDKEDALSENETGAFLSGAGSLPVEAEAEVLPPDIQEESPLSQQNSIIIRQKKTGGASPQAVYSDTVIGVTSLNGNLPFFTLPADLDIDQYLLVFQVLGARGVLNQIEKPIFYVADAAFTLKDIQAYLPGTDGSARPNIIPPGINVLLEAQILSDSRLDPYVVWYNGKKEVSAGFLADGLDRLIWKVPAQTGFHTLRVELYPFRPGGRSAAQLSGMVKELSLPVSAKQENKAAASKDAGYKPLRWYRMGGNLQDAVNPGDAAASLLPLEDSKVQWAPHRGIYGLSIGPGYAYAIPGTPLNLSGDAGPSGARKEGVQGNGMISIRFAPLAAGTILSGVFPLSGSASKSAVDMHLTYGENSLTLTCVLDDQSITQSIAFNPQELRNFITAVVHLRIEKARFFIGLSAELANVSLDKRSIALKTPIRGADFRLGAVVRSTAKASGESAAAKFPAAVLNELMFMVCPGIQENGNQEAEALEAADPVESRFEVEIPQVQRPFPVFKEEKSEFTGQEERQSAFQEGDADEIADMNVPVEPFTPPPPPPPPYQFTGGRG